MELPHVTNEKTELSEGKDAPETMQLLSDEARENQNLWVPIPVYCFLSFWFFPYSSAWG